MSGDQKVTATIYSLIGAAVITLIGCVTLCTVQCEVSYRRQVEAFVEAGYEQQMVAGYYRPVWVKADGACKCGPACKCEVNSKLWPDPANESGVK